MKPISKERFDELSAAFNAASLVKRLRMPKAVKVTALPTEGGYHTLPEYSRYYETKPSNLELEAASEIEELIDRVNELRALLHSHSTQTAPYLKQPAPSSSAPAISVNPPLGKTLPSLAVGKTKDEDSEAALRWLKETPSLPSSTVPAKDKDVMPSPASGMSDESKKKTYADHLPRESKYLLSLLCEEVLKAYPDAGIYLVGSALFTPNYRDVDVRAMLFDDDFDAIFGEKAAPADRLGLTCRAISAWMKSITGLPIDFQFQRQSVANKKHKGSRHALFVAPWAGDAINSPYQP